MSKADFTARQAAIAPAVTELGKPEIKAGQVWRCRDGVERTVVGNDGNLFYPWDLSDGGSVNNRGRERDDKHEYSCDLIELIKDENGFTIWRGGECPVPGDAAVHVRLRAYSGVNIDSRIPARCLSWEHHGSAADIVAYKVAEAVAEAPAAIGIDPGAKDGDHTVIAMMYAVSGAAKDAREYTGGKVNYYEVQIESPTHEGREPYIAECNDIIEALDMSFAEGEAFKAIWRGAAARKNLAKRGYTDGLYDAEKVAFYGGRMVVQEKSRREKSSSKD